MSPSQSSQRVSLPSIHEMFPEHLMALPPRKESLAPPMLSPPLVHATTSNPASGRPRLSADQPSAHAPTSPRSSSEPLMAARRASQADGDERRHACRVCGKAFNRPSSLAIHVNTHTGAKPFECPFPGCGRRFNVNSNMRRHLRNHTSPARPINTASPYTYPLTTVPRSLYPFSSSSNCGPPMHPPAAHISQYRSSDTGSDDDELSESDRWEQERELTKGVDRLRLRAYSASSTVSSPRMQPAVVPRRPRANSCAVPGCRGCRDCASAARPTVLHPSGEVYRSRPGR